MATNDEKLKAIFNHFGVRSQISKSCEEAEDLVEAIDIWWTGDEIDDVEQFNHMLEEMSANLVVLRQFELKYPKITEIYNTKIDRTIDRYDIKV
jgi:hypothetical protein